jgi:hypothetical protein
MPGVLSVFECASIQSYIFASNRLRENVGASQLVVEALDGDLPRSIEAVVPGSRTEDWRTNPQAWLANGDVAEVLYIGGGNAFVFFPSLSIARNVASAWSRTLLKKAPGLRPMCAHVEYAELQPSIKAVMRALDTEKRAPVLDGELQCLPVTRRCASTGLAASTSYRFPGEEPEWVSRATMEKRGAAGRAGRRLGDAMFRAGLPDGMHFPDKLDDLVSEGEPQIAVIHIDGNGIGNLFRRATEAPGSDAELATRLRTLSIGIDRSAGHTLENVTEWLVRRSRQLTSDKNTGCIAARPIVFGGDDITLVTRGRLGLELAAEYLARWSEEALPDGTHLSACAGVAIVRSHFPFKRAYDLADELCKNAKKSARVHSDEDESWLDFEVVMSGAIGNLEQVRQRREQAAGIQKQWRPWRVAPADETDGHDWSLLQDMARVFGSGSWPQARSKALRDAYYLGREAGVAELLSQFIARGVTLPRIAEIYSHAQGYFDYTTAYLDGLEAVEFMPKAEPSAGSEVAGG